MNRLAWATAIAVLMIMAGVTGRMDYEAALQEQAHYCEMVREGAWPAYRGGCDEG